MGLSRDKITGAYTMDINYKKHEEGADFYIPTPHTQNSNLTFDKAESFGFKVCAPYDFTYDPEDKAYTFDLGLEIELPPGTCFLILSLKPDHFENYVIDNGEPNKFFPITLYFKEAKAGGTTTEYKKGEPLLWVLPIPDMAYSYQYRKKGGLIG